MLIEWLLMLSCSQVALTQISHPLICIDQTEIQLALINQDDKLILYRGKTISKLKYLDTVLVRLMETDLMLEFKSLRQEKDYKYQIEFYLITENNRTLKPQPRHVIGFNEMSTGTFSQIVWQDFTELGLNLNQSFTLIIRTALHGELKINCAGDIPAPPLNNVLAKRLYLVAGLVGSGLGIFSLIQRSDARKSYDDYKLAWLENSPEKDARPHFEKAKEKNVSFKSVGFIGAGILAATALVYLDNYRKYQRDRKRYEKYCCGAVALELSPMLEVGQTLANSSLGVSLKLHF